MFVKLYPDRPNHWMNQLKKKIYLLFYYSNFIDIINTVTEASKFLEKLVNTGKSC